MVKNINGFSSEVIDILVRF